MTTDAPRIRVLVCASDAVTGTGLASYLGSQPGLAITPGVAAYAADVVVMATDLVNTEAITQLRTVANAAPQGRTVLITNHLAEPDLPAAVECRVVSVLSRNTGGVDLVNAVRAAATGRASLPVKLLSALSSQVGNLRTAGATTRDGLTAREIEVLRFLADGADTGEIAHKLCYSERTVKNILYAILNRLNLRNRAHAVAYAMRAGVIH